MLEQPAWMMGYSDRVRDRCGHLRNAGSLDGADPRVGTGLAGAPGLGDVVRIQIRVGGDQVVEDARFKAFGCASTIAGASVAAEWARGRTLDETLRITNTAIARELDLPPSKVHCALVAEDALKAAVQDFLGKQESGGSPDRFDNNPAGGPE